MYVDWDDLPDPNRLPLSRLKEFLTEWEQISQDSQFGDLSRDELKKLALDRVLARPKPKRRTQNFPVIDSGPYSRTSPAVEKERYGIKEVADGVFFIHQTTFRCRAYPQAKRRNHSMDCDGASFLVTYAKGKRTKSWVSTLGNGLTYGDVASLVRRAGFDTVGSISCTGLQIKCFLPADRSRQERTTPVPEGFVEVTPMRRFGIGEFALRHSTDPIEVHCYKVHDYAFGIGVEAILEPDASCEIRSSSEFDSAVQRLCHLLADFLEGEELLPIEGVPANPNLPSGRIIRSIPDRDSDIREGLRQYLMSEARQGKIVHTTAELAEILGKDVRRTNECLSRWGLTTEVAPGSYRGSCRRWWTSIAGLAK